MRLNSCPTPLALEPLESNAGPSPSAEVLNRFVPIKPGLTGDHLAPLDPTAPPLPLSPSSGSANKSSRGDRLFRYSLCLSSRRPNATFSLFAPFDCPDLLRSCALLSFSNLDTNSLPFDRPILVPLRHRVSEAEKVRRFLKHASVPACPRQGPFPILVSD